jgi:hypothetical protein
MKLDKETLIKEHFWFLLGLLVALVLLSLILVSTTTSGAIAAVKKTYDENTGKVKTIANSTPKTSAWWNELDKKHKDVEAQKTKIWEKAWKEQAGLMTWPKMNAEDLAALNQLYFGDPISADICSRFAEPYSPQVEEAVKIVQPDVVQFRDSWQSMIRWVPKWLTVPPTSEDVWLAQEDLVVQRGLFQIIRQTNDYLAAFRVVTDRNAKSKLFASSDWALDLTLTSAEGKSALQYLLTNIGGRRQTLGITLQVAFAGAKPYNLEVQGEPLAPGQSTTQTQPLPPQQGTPSALKSVRQVFDWRTVPIKRIDAVALGYPSSRTSQSPLVTGPATPKEEKKDDTAQGGRSVLNKGGGNMDPTVTQGGGLANRGASQTRTTNGLEQDRYISVSEQVRRMPFGMVLVIDQGHIQDFLTEMANSPLRIQILQWHWNHFHGDIKDPKEQEISGSGPTRDERPGARPGTAPGPLKGGKPGPAPVNKGPITTQPGFNRETGSVATAEERSEWDLVELAVYGITSLYERYPPKSKQAPADSKTVTGPGTLRPVR